MSVTASAANPYTAHLLGRLPPGRADIAAFVADWDRLEALVIRVFRAGAAGAEDAAEWADLRATLARRYDGFVVPLAIHWPRAQEGGVPCSADPFRRLLAIPTAASFVDDRTALRTLPAAREAVNRWLVALADSDVDVDGAPPVIPPA